MFVRAMLSFFPKMEVGEIVKIDAVINDFLIKSLRRLFSFDFNLC